MAIDTRTPAELEVAKTVEAELAAGGDPYGDDEPLVAETIEVQANAAAQAQADEGGNSAPGALLPATDEQAPAGTAEEAAPEVVAEPQALPQYTVDGTDFAAQRAALRAERREVEAKWASGELSDDDRATALDELQDKSDALLIEQTRASTLAEANAQAEQRAAESRANAETAAMRAVAEAAKASGQIDYASDIKAQKQFDVMFTAVKADPDNADKTSSQLVQEAHKAVLALRGIADKTPAKERTAPPAPPTLRNLPNATTSNSGGTVADSIGRLTGAAYQAAFAKLTPAQKAALVDD